MWPFHRHRPVEVARTYAQPLTGPRAPLFIGDWPERCQAMGLTTILTRCECGKMRTFQMLGRTTDDDLERMLRTPQPPGGHP